MRPAGGGQLDPATDAVFRAWIAEGQVTADAQIRRDDWAEWKLARDAVDDLPIPLAAVPVSTPPEPVAAIPPVLPPESVEKVEIPVVPEPVDSAAVESLPADAMSTPPAPLAAAQYKLQRRRMQKTQLTLAIAMLVAVIVLAGVLIWVIRNSGGPTASASIQTATCPTTVDLGRPAWQSEAT